ncbi:MAG: insulinase family protein [Bryobacterales bacterium]|nr:insulinase family protein [Bryobacterales bacterium]
MKTAAALLTLAPMALAVTLPPFEKETLPNGVTVCLMPRRDTPLIAVQVTLRGGSEADPAGQAGLSALTAELLRRGSGSRTADEFAEALDYLGAAYSAGTQPQAIVLRLEFLSKDAEAALGLLADAVARPAFAEEEVRKAVEQAADEVRSLKDQPGQAAQLYFRSLFYGPEHPYGRPPRGDEISLAKVSRADVVAHHKKLYTGRNLIVTAAGDFDSGAFRTLLRKTFGGLPAGEAYRWREAPPIPAAKEPTLWLIDKPDATQTYFLIGQPGLARTSPDRVPAQLVNALFGGRFTSLLNDALRVDSGLTYGARSVLDLNRLPGAISMYTFTRTDATKQAVDLALDVLGKLRKNGVNEEQLASTKAYIKGSYPTERLETADQLAGLLAEMELYGLGRDEVDDFFARVDAVTVEDANRIVRKYYSSDALQFLLLGNASAIRESVAGYAEKRKEIPVTSPGFGGSH